eukprot:3940591-Rhodomonas_salina.2
MLARMLQHAGYHAMREQYNTKAITLCGTTHRRMSRSNTTNSTVAFIPDIAASGPRMRRISVLHVA